MERQEQDEPERGEGIPSGGQTTGSQGLPPNLPLPENDSNGGEENTTPEDTSQTPPPEEESDGAITAESNEQPPTQNDGSSSSETTSPEENSDRSITESTQETSPNDTTEREPAQEDEPVPNIGDRVGGATPKPPRIIGIGGSSNDIPPGQPCGGTADCSNGQVCFKLNGGQSTCMDPTAIPCNNTSTVFKLTRA